MTRRTYHLATILIVLGNGVQAQQPLPQRYQPYTPPVVGGLPPNSRGLEQPVYVADRIVPNVRSGTENDVENFSQVFEASGLGLDEQKVIPGIEQMSVFEAGMIIAAVGDERITVGDLIDPNKLTPQIVQSPQFEMALRKALVECVTRKALAQGFVNDKVAGKSVKERKEAKKQMEVQTTKMFFEKYLPKAKKDLGIESDLEFEDALLKKGQSLHSLKRDFTESALASEHISESVPEKPIVDLSEMQDYYNNNIDSFRKPARVRFQIMSAMFNKHPSKQAAYQAIVEMGNEVYVGGASFDGVAKRKSTGFRAAEGGLFDWTTQGSLKSKVIDKTIFEIPVRGLSQIQEDSDGFYIVEVLAREPASVKSFVEAQAEIRSLLIKQKSTKLRTDFIKKVREGTPVWTKWPQDIPGSQDLSLIMQ
ncbi:MAG: peptidyl-prolyl cis-trans isomerase [Pirellula sp.]